MEVWLTNRMQSTCGVIITLWKVASPCCRTGRNFLLTAKVGTLASSRRFSYVQCIFFLDKPSTQIFECFQAPQCPSSNVDPTHCRHVLGVDISEIGTNIEVSVVQSEDKISK